MKQWSYLVLLTALAGAGCLPNSFLGNKEKPPPVKMQPPPAPPPRPAPVTNTGITRDNAAERARALREELEYEQAHQMKSVTVDPTDNRGG